MFEFFNFARRKRLTFADLQSIQVVAQQVVLSLDGSVKMAGPTKKVVAMKIARELLGEMNIDAPEGMIDTAIEASVRTIRMLSPQAPKASQGVVCPISFRSDGKVAPREL